MEQRLQNVLERIRDLFVRVLGENLLGVYVHGSLAFGCFTWETGDIDLLVVAREEPGIEMKRAVIGGIMEIEADAPPKGIEMSVVLERDCRSFVHPMPYVLHYSKAHTQHYLENMDGHIRRLRGCDPDLAAHITVVRAVGYPLMGPDVKDVFSKVPAADYLDSIRGDVQDARQQIHEDPVYIILNLCRVLAYLRDDSVISKADGGKWGMDNLPGEYIPLIRAALKSYSAGSVMREDFEDEALDRYAAYMTGAIRLEAL